ncbi:hypothetical protein IV203_012369 [Nitzschia inconspicua]|uniref:Uncharacterized protein n=1 Tax=Nitzschia inconspicua TaxID=303405 RepID=A0A9K3KU17_9STRA|nr:hypothetical protein IV203_012369 [Nitzschia inconspicua]
MFSSCIQHFCNTDDERDYYDFCDSNAIVEITLQRDYLLLKLQELVDSKTSRDAELAIRAMDEASSADDVRLMRFLVRAGVISILEDVLERKDGRPSSTIVHPLLKKLTQYEAAASRETPSSIWIR